MHRLFAARKRLSAASARITGTVVTQDLGGISRSAMASAAAEWYSRSYRCFRPSFEISMTKERLIPLIVATALFMENMDSTVIATSLPAIAADIGASPLTLKLAITSYLLSLAVFIPASGWTADRFGARMVFSCAVAVFMLGSIGCALSSDITQFVIARILQGLGGAMMTPVGRLVLLRSIDKSALVNAMAWVTVPALVGPVIGPPLGGFITTYLTWHWIFLINIPIGLLGIFMALRYIDPIRSEDPERFDLYGLVLAGIGLGGIAFGLSIAGLNLVHWTVVVALVGIGTISMTLYVIHARRTASPVLDFALLRLPTMRASIIGGFLFRLGIGALPFLLPLLMQVGFGLSPLRSGLVTFASAVGAMGMKTLAARIIRTFGFRNIMTINAVVSSVFLAACALFTITTPLLLIMILLVVGGFFRSLQFTAINTLAYAEVEPAQMSRATTLVSVNQQLAVSAGVAVGAFSVESTLWYHHTSELIASDFAPGFIVVAIISTVSSYFFFQMPTDAGHQVSGRGVIVVTSPERDAEPEETAATETANARDQRLG
jgi:EmrB/QacA subfamily drug resistance transporter